MQNISVIDIGSNSMRVLVYEIYPNKSFKIIDEEKRMTRLGQYIDENDNLSDDGIEKLLITLDFFKILCTKNHVEEIIVVATEAIRRAKNNKLILSMIEYKTGFKIRILSGLEESTYGYLAIKTTINLDNAILIDIGGSSMELTLVRNKKICEGISLPLGAIPLTKIFPFDKPANKNDKLDFKNFIFKEFDKISWLKYANKFPLIGIGGTLRAIGKIHKKLITYPLDLLHNYTIPIDEINLIYNYVLNLTVAQKAKLKGLPKERVDIFAAPFSALVMLMEYCSCPILKISQYGIREGVLYEKLLGENIHEVNITDFSIDNILTNHDLNIEHSEKIKDLTNILFKYLELHNTKNKSLENKILNVAAKLHDVGSSISLKHAYKHSFYIIINSLLSGLNHKEILMIAYTVALSGKFDYKLNDEYKELLSKEDILICKKLSVIICLSHKIDKYFYDSIKEVVIANTEDEFKIALPEVSIKYMKDSLPTEMDESFKKCFDKKLSIVSIIN